MQEPSPRTLLLASASIAGVLFGRDIVRLVTTGRIPPGELRHSALAAATLLAALGLTGRHTLRTLDLARRIEHARAARGPGAGPRVIKPAEAVRQSR